MSYMVLRVQAVQWFAEVLQAELAASGFDIFLETETGFETSIDKELFAPTATEVLLQDLQQTFDETCTYMWEETAKQNWNEVWESNFEPVVVADQCLIRADFHPYSGKYPYELVITPKMSFGTGHHATTSLMLQHLLETPLQGKKVADCGCGTGILAIMAMKLGAKTAVGCDIEDWAVENTLENATQNQVELTALQGTAKNLLQLPATLTEPFEVVIANIQLNVLLEEMPIYAALLPKGGTLLLSGIHEAYNQLVIESANTHHLQLTNQKQQNEWAALKLEKNNIT